MPKCPACRKTFYCSEKCAATNANLIRKPGWAALSRAFGNEFANLSEAEAELVRRDYLLALAEDNISAGEYHDRIGPGNLKSYAEVLAVQARRTA